MPVQQVLEKLWGMPVQQDSNSKRYSCHPNRINRFIEIHNFPQNGTFFSPKNSLTSTSHSMASLVFGFPSHDSKIVQVCASNLLNNCYHPYEVWHPNWWFPSLASANQGRDVRALDWNSPKVCEESAPSRAAGGIKQGIWFCLDQSGSFSNWSFKQNQSIMA